MKTVVPTTIRLEEYVPPSFNVDHTHLTFGLHSSKTRVTQQTRYSAKDGESPESLSLHGIGIALEQIEMDGVSLVDGEDFKITDEILTLNTPKTEFLLTITNYIDPSSNAELEGLYKSGTMFCTQCEAEGFRRITYFMDRPDVMTKYVTKIIAPKSEYPVLLSNGNPIASGDLDDGLHFVEWEDPFKKPTYLFALVAGDLGVVKDTFTTVSGRQIDLRVYCDKGNEDKCSYTIESLKASMAWDEKRWGLEYDLDIYMIVAVDSFNMGAMENKGLNIFNTKYVLASPDTATDATYASIQGIVGHEYFHNWTGNRVTCRDWFQLTLKEGLTVFRDQEFSADLNSRAAVRVADVDSLKISQFVEDAGPNAHPIKPKAYMDINNFYTATVYSKGAEVIRMYHTLLGEKGFRRGIDKYFELYDGMAVTTEDFLHAMSTANDDYDFSHFSKWYDQAGTPLLVISDHYDEVGKCYNLKVSQTNKPTPGQKDKIPLFMPFKIGLLGSDGHDMELATEGDQPQISDGILHIKHEEETFSFSNVSEKPVLSLNRNFSAPVNLEYKYTDNELAFLMANDSDPVARYSACQLLFQKVILEKIDKMKKGESYELSESFITAIEKTLGDQSVDMQIKSLSLSLPSPSIIAQKLEVIDYVAIYQAMHWLKEMIATTNKNVFMATYKQLNLAKQYAFNDKDAGERALANMLCDYLAASQDIGAVDRVYQQYVAANNMTTRLGAFKALVFNQTQYESEVIDDFYQSCRISNTSLLEWMKVISCDQRPGGLERLRRVLAVEEFDIKVPNFVYASICAFGVNYNNFHAKDGKGYEFMADKVIELDRINTQVAARAATLFKQYSYLDNDQRSLMKTQLERIKKCENLSKGTFEIISKTLGL